MDEVDMTVVHSLKKVAKGSVLVLIGSVFYYIAQFLFRALLARGLPAADYGSIAFSLALANTATVTALLGIPVALPRQIASSRSKDKDSRATATAGLIVTSISAFFTSLLLFFLSDHISVLFSGISPDVLAIFSLSIFFIALLRVSVAIARGYEDVFILVIYQHFLYGILAVVSAFFAGILFHSSVLVAVLYLLSIALTSFFALVSVIRRGYISLHIPSLPVAHSLLLFSLPLFASTIIAVVFGRMDTFMIGYFLDSAAVGVYNVALTVVNALPFFLVATSFLYLPIASSLVSRKDLSTLKRFYQVLTKWITVFTLPLFAVVVLFPHTVIAVFFGHKYLAAATPLVILALANMIHTSLGANGWTLIAFGETKFTFRYTVASAVINFVLNAVLIPRSGISGAALATAISLVFVNVVASAFLYMKYHIHPFTRHYISPFLSAFIPLMVLKLLNIPAHGILPLFLILVLYLITYGTLLLLFRIFEKEDVELLHLLEHRLGLNLGPLKSFLRHFL